MVKPERHIQNLEQLFEEAVDYSRPSWDRLCKQDCLYKAKESLQTLQINHCQNCFPSIEVVAIRKEIQRITSWEEKKERDFM